MPSATWFMAPTIWSIVSPDLVARLPTARQSRHRPPTRPRGGRTPRETRQNLPVDALRPVWQEWDGMNESEKQFSFTRVASSTNGHAKKQIPISKSNTNHEYTKIEKDSRQGWLAVGGSLPGGERHGRRNSLGGLQLR